MSVDSQHPAYSARLPDWTLLGHCLDGERAVKEQGEVYLPPTAGMRANGYGTNPSAPGQLAYDAYRLRAVFHEFVHDTVRGLIGVLHRKPPTIEVPAPLEEFRKNATIKGESIEQLWRRISEAQLGHGRCGLLTDVPDGRPVNEALPYVALYGAPAIINWDVGTRRQGREVLELVVLDESSHERKRDLSWEWKKQYRVLALADTAVELGGDVQGASGAYVVATVRVDGEDGADEELGGGELEVTGKTFIAPGIGGRTLEEVPFVFVNPNDLVADPDVPPFLGIANLSMAIYRGEADYRQTLFMQGQASIVRIGATEEQQQIPTGAGAVIDLGIGGDAKYIGAPADGISEQRQALENDKKEASQLAIQFLDQEKGRDAESGESIRMRTAARTATLHSLQLAAAGAIKDVLVFAGRFLGLSEEVLDGIVVTPNLKFAEDQAQADELNKLMDAVQKNLPLSLESLHAWLVARGYSEKTFEEEMELIKAEQTDGMRPDPVAEAAAAAELEKAALDGQFGEDDAGGKDEGAEA